MVYAVGTVNLTLFVDVMKSSFYSCMWSYKYVGAMSQYETKIEVYSNSKCKKDGMFGFNETATCSVNSTMLSTMLIFMQPLKFGRMFANFSCDSNLYYNGSFNIVCKALFGVCFYQKTKGHQPLQIEQQALFLQI